MRIVYRGQDIAKYCSNITFSIAGATTAIGSFTPEKRLWGLIQAKTVFDLIKLFNMESDIVRGFNTKDFEFIYEHENRLLRFFIMPTNIEQVRDNTNLLSFSGHEKLQEPITWEFISLHNFLIHTPASGVSQVKVSLNTSISDCLKMFLRQEKGLSHLNHSIVERESKTIVPIPASILSVPVLATSQKSVPGKLTVNRNIGLLKTIENKLDNVIKLEYKINNLIDSIKNRINNLINIAKRIINKICNIIIGAINKVKGAILGVVNKIMDIINKGVSILNSVRKWLSRIVNKILNIIRNAYSIITNALSIVSTVLNGINQLINKIIACGDNIIGTVLSVPNYILSTVREVVRIPGRMANRYINIFTPIPSALDGFKYAFNISNITSKYKALLNKKYSLSERLYLESLFSSYKTTASNMFDSSRLFNVSLKNMNGTVYYIKDENPFYYSNIVDELNNPGNTPPSLKTSLEYDFSIKDELINNSVLFINEIVDVLKEETEIFYQENKEIFDEEGVSFQKFYDSLDELKEAAEEDMLINYPEEEIIESISEGNDIINEYNLLLYYAHKSIFDIKWLIDQLISMEEPLISGSYDNAVLDPDLNIEYIFEYDPVEEHGRKIYASFYSKLIEKSSSELNEMFIEGRTAFYRMNQILYHITQCPIANFRSTKYVNENGKQKAIHRYRVYPAFDTRYDWSFIFRESGDNTANTITLTDAQCRLIEMDERKNFFSPEHFAKRYSGIRLLYSNPVIINKKKSYGIYVPLYLLVLTSLGSEGLFCNNIKENKQYIEVLLEYAKNNKPMDIEIENNGVWRESALSSLGNLATNILESFQMSIETRNEDIGFNVWPGDVIFIPPHDPNILPHTFSSFWVVLRKDIIHEIRTGDTTGSSNIGGKIIKLTLSRSNPLPLFTGKNNENFNLERLYTGDLDGPYTPDQKKWKIIF